MNDNTVCPDTIVEEATRPTLNTGDNTKDGYYIGSAPIDGGSFPGFNVTFRQPIEGRNCLTCTLACPLKGVERS